jgi:hypothetical protein
MHRVRLALSQVKPLSWLRPGSGIPSISTAYAQARRRCAQVIHMFVHRQQGSSPAGWPIRPCSDCPRDSASPTGHPGWDRGVDPAQTTAGSGKPTAHAWACMGHYGRRDVTRAPVSSARCSGEGGGKRGEARDVSGRSGGGGRRTRLHTAISQQSVAADGLAGVVAGRRRRQSFYRAVAPRSMRHPHGSGR